MIGDMAELFYERTAQEWIKQAGGNLELISGAMTYLRLYLEEQTKEKMREGI